VHELIAENSSAYDALLGWISDQRDAWRLIRYDAAPDERFDHRLTDPRPPGYRTERSLWTPTYRAIRGPMLRVLDVAAALERRVRWGSAPPLRFGVEIVDDIITDNAGPFTVDFDGSRAAVTRGRAARPSLSTDMQTFTQIFAGELLVTEAISLGTAQVSGDASSLNVVFRADRCFRLLDEF
jgi:predicted acetyltransferase